eukprot:scaffold468007_cov25-Prasinocladus_malaysianus.AAC.1
MYLLIWHSYSTTSSTSTRTLLKRFYYENSYSYSNYDSSLKLRLEFVLLVRASYKNYLVALPATTARGLYGPTTAGADVRCR